MLAWIHEFAPYGVITTDTRFRIQSWNRWMTAHTGRTLEEVSQQPLLELFPEIEERRLLPRLERALEGESSLLSTALHSYILRLDSPVRHPAFPQMQQTGRIAPLLFQKETIGVIIVVEDVTQREIQSYLLRQQHDRDRLLSWALAHLLTSEEPRRTVRELFYKVAEYSDFDGYLLYLFDGNAGAYRLQSAGGVTPEQEETLSGLDPSSPLANLLLSSSEPRAWERLQENPQSPLGRELGFSMTALLPLVGSRGQFGLLCFGSRSRPALNENELELLSTIGKYLAVALQKEFTTTQLHAAQNKLNQHAQELERQVAERTASLCDIIAELETFSYTLSHDLRAPIRSLIGYSEVLIEDYANILPEEGKLVIQRLNRACSQLDALTRDLLEFSKVSRQDIRLVPVHLDALVQDIVSLFPAAQGRLSVKRPLDPVLAHPGLLQQCIANLIDNALKFVKAGQLAPD